MNWIRFPTFSSERAAPAPFLTVSSTTGIRDPRIAKVKEELIEAGADPAIAYRHMPHVGTDVLRIVVKNIRKKILSLGGEIRFETQVTGLQFHPDGEKARERRKSESPR